MQAAFVSSTRVPDTTEARNRQSYFPESETSSSPTSSNNFCFDDENENIMVDGENSPSSELLGDMSVIKKNKIQRSPFGVHRTAHSAPTSPGNGLLDTNQDGNHHERKRRYSDIESKTHYTDPFRPDEKNSLKKDSPSPSEVLDRAFDFIKNFTKYQDDFHKNKRSRSNRNGRNSSVATEVDSGLDETVFVDALKQELATAIKDAVETSALKILEKFETEKGFSTSKFLNRSSINDSIKNLTTDPHNKLQTGKIENFTQKRSLSEPMNRSHSEEIIDISDNQTQCSIGSSRTQETSDSEVFEDGRDLTYQKNNKSIMLPTNPYLHRIPKIETTVEYALTNPTHAIFDQKLLAAKHRNLSYPPPMPIPISLSQAFDLAKAPEMSYATSISKFGNMANFASTGQISPTVGTVPVPKAFVPADMNRSVPTYLTDYRTYIHNQFVASKLPKVSPFATYPFSNLAFVPGVDQKAQFAAVLATMNQRIRERMNESITQPAHVHHVPNIPEQRYNQKRMDKEYGGTSTRTTNMAQVLGRETCFRRSFPGMMQDGLTPQHLKKAKLMFFYTRYPNANTLKSFFPDVKFTRAITSQLIKWFSNFREFFYIQMEKFARQAVQQGVVDASVLRVSRDSEIFRVLNIHYNKCNEFHVPPQFLMMTEASLREFFNAVRAGKDSDPAWKKVIYKVICKLDSEIPELFKSPTVLDRLHELYH